MGPGDLCADPGAGCAPVARVLTGHRGEVWAIAFSPDGRWLASASADATVRIWRTATGEVRSLTGHTRAVRDVVFSPDGRHLASAGEDHEPWLWDVAAGTGAPLPGHAGRVTRVRFSPDGQWLVTASEDHTVRRWRVATGASIPVAGQAFALSPDGRALAVGQDDRAMWIDLATGDAHVLGRHRGAVFWLEFSPDGAHLASISLREHAVRVWDVRQGVLAAVLPQDLAVRSASFSPDARWMAAADGAVVRVWPVSETALVARDPAGVAVWLATRSTATLASRDDRP